MKLAIAKIEELQRDCAHMAHFKPSQAINEYTINEARLTAISLTYALEVLHDKLAVDSPNEGSIGTPMTTKEEVMILCKTAGVISAMYGDEPIVKLIELAKSQGIEDAIMRDQFCRTGVFDEEGVKYRMADIYDEFVDEAIHKRESKS